jgi:hypothetical protein
MSRKSAVLALAKEKFSFYTEEVALFIRAYIKEHRCSDTSDELIQALWKHFASPISFSFAQLQQASKLSQQLSPEAVEMLRTELDRALDYEAALEDLESDKLAVQYSELRMRQHQARQQRRAAEGAEFDRFDFFSTEPDATADFSLWPAGRMISPEQGVALSLGVNPDKVNLETLGPLRRVSGSPFREEFARRLQLAESAVQLKDVPAPMRLSEFYQWSVGCGIAWPDDARPLLHSIEPDWKKRAQELEGQIARLQERNVELEDSFRRLEAKTKETEPFEAAKGETTKKTAYKLILGMAILEFDHRVIGNSHGPKKIQMALEDLPLRASQKGSYAGIASADLEALKLTDDTILKALNEAANFLGVR